MKKLKAYLTIANLILGILGGTYSMKVIQRILR